MKTKNIKDYNNSKMAKDADHQKETSVAISEVFFKSELILGIKIGKQLDDTLL